jgi:hypothetical protein
LLKDRTQMVRELVTDPRAFFDGKAQDRSITREVTVVILVGLLGSAGAYYFTQRVFDLAETSGYSNFQMIGMTIEPIIGIGAFWLGGAVAAHFLAGFYQGRGPIRRLLKLSAWATVPIAVGNAVRSVVIYLSYNDVTADQVNFDDTTTFDEKAAAIREAVSNDALVVVSFVVTILSVVAAWFLLSYAVATAKQVEIDDARKIAALPSAVFVLWLLNAMLTSLGVL